MKRFILLLAVISLCQTAAFGQKKYEMVIEKTDGSEIVTNVEDIVRTYFREKNTGDDNGNVPEGVEAVDLGLPSGTKWASTNIGANKPESIGNYYTWAQCDMALATWGGDWELPTRYDYLELINNCSTQKTTLNGIIGWEFTGPNGNSVFFPYRGAASFWTSTLSPVYENNAIVFYVDDKEPSFTNRGFERKDVCIRPVIGHAPSGDSPSSDLNEQQLIGKWICYYQQWIEDGDVEDMTYSSDNIYIVLNADHTGCIRSGNGYEELFEIGTGGKEDPFKWYLSGMKIVVDDGSCDEWEVLSLSDNELELRWGDEDYSIIGRFKKNAGGEN